MSQDITLQINLSPGDIQIADRMVSHIIRSHRVHFAERLLILDVNRPQRTPIVDPDKRFPVEQFHERVKALRSVANTLLESGAVDRVEVLDRDHPLQVLIASKYLRGLTNGTHDYGGCALTSYLAAFELVKTPYLLHYDADMLLYQEGDYDWAIEGKQILESKAEYAAVTPRLAPVRENLVSTPTLYDWPVSEKVEWGWRDQWFSTRVFLFKRELLLQNLPLMRGMRYLRAVVRKLLNRGFPVSPEVMISARMKQLKKYHLQLESTKAWVLHPREKTDAYHKYLSSIILRVEEGCVPEHQKGYPDILPEYDLWSASKTL